MDWTNRPGRMTAGLGIIALGVALLAEHLNGINYLPILLRFWPLVLVGVGLETLAASRRGPVRLDLGALILLVIVGTVAQAATAGWSRFGPLHFEFGSGIRVQPGGGPARYEHREARTLDGVEELEVVGGPARVQVLPSQTNGVQLVLLAVGRGQDEADARKHAEAVEMRVSEGRSARVSLAARRPGLPVEQLALVVEVPAGVRKLRLDTGSGGADLREIRADLELDTGSGGVTIRDPGGRVTLDGGSGPILLETDRMGGDYRLNTGSGAVEIRIPAGSDVRVEGETGSGPVTGPAWLRVDDHEVSGRQGAGTYLIELDTGSGSVRIVEQ